MTSTFSVSINSVVRSVYARSALKSFMTLQSVDMPPLLTSDNQTALAEAVRSFAHIDIPALLGRSCSVTANGDDILEVSFDPVIAPSLSLVNTVESILASRIIARLFSAIDSKFADESDADACRATEVVRANLFPDGDPVPVSDDNSNIPVSVRNSFF